ncbi:MAG: glycosyltransferase family 4 protein [Armatimonadota bacterium]
MPRTVLHFIYSLRTGGAERSCVEICTNLPAEYTPVVCATRGGPYEAELRGAGIEVITFAPPDEHPRWPLVAARIVRVLRQVKPDLVHTHLYHSNVLALTAASLLGVPGVGHLRGRSSCGLSRAEQRVCGLVYRWLVRRGHRFIACSQDMAALFREVTGHEATVIHNAIDTRPFLTAHPGGVDLRAELGVPPDAPLVGFVGRLVYQKNPQCFVRAAARLGAGHPQAHFVMVGGGELRGEIEALGRELGLGERLHLLGECHDVPTLLPQFDVFALPSRWEGFSRAILEAMVCGLAVVTTDVLGARESVVDGESGLLVPDDDDAALAGRIGELLADEGLRRALGRAARERVMRDFTLEALIGRVVEQYEAVLEEQIAAARPAGMARCTTTSRAGTPR